jgi:hypothetical protein
VARSLDDKARPIEREKQPETACVRSDARLHRFMKLLERREPPRGGGADERSARRRAKRLAVPCVLAFSVVGATTAFVASCDDASKPEPDAGTIARRDAISIDAGPDASPDTPIDGISLDSLDSAIADARADSSLADARVDASPPDAAPDTPT